MGLGVLEPKHQGIKVPGTVHIERDTELLRMLTANLKHDTGRDEAIVLVPQPSDSVNDPLSWSTRTKWFHSIFLSFGTGLASGTCYFLNPSAVQMSKEIGTSVTKLSRSLSVLILCMGVASILTTPLARIYGKRPGMLLSSALFFLLSPFTNSKITSIPSARPHWHYWLRRLAQSPIRHAIHLRRPRSLGAGQSSLEYLDSSSVGDLFFVHQRGVHLAVWHFALGGGSSLGQVIASQIVAGQNFVWAFLYAVIFMSAYIVAFFLLFSETTYNRPQKFDNDVRELLANEESIEGSKAAQERTLHDSDLEKKMGQPHVQDAEAGIVPATSDDAALAETKKSYLQSLKVYNGRFSDESYGLALVAPFATYLLPGVI